MRDKWQQEFTADPRVDEAWDEGDDGLWVSLRAGWKWGGGDTHFLHERSVGALRREMKNVKRCFCLECRLAEKRP